MLYLSRAERPYSPEDGDAVRTSKQHWGNPERLTQDEVNRLAQLKDAGIAAKAQLEQPDCTDIATLTRIADQGLAARNQLVEANLPLVTMIARSWTGRGLAYEDLVQEGSIGLMRAVDAYDWSKGVKFSGFAGLRVLQACQRAVENFGNAIRIPVHTRSSGRCAPEVARALHLVSGDKPRDIYSKQGDMSDKNMELGLFNRIGSGEEIDTHAINRVLVEIGLAALTDERERTIVEMFYLLDVSLPDIASKLGITKQRVGQLKDNAIANMRAVLCEVENDHSN